VAAAKTVDPLHNLYQQMGEASAGIRSINHAVNGVSQKVDGLNEKVESLASIVAAQGHLREDVSALKQFVETQASEISALKADKHRKEGERGVLTWMARNWPGAALMGFLAAFIAWANGKLPV
jgi:uncharacterized protein YoxC